MWAIATGLWELSGPNMSCKYMIAFAFPIHVVMATLNYEPSFITSGAAELSKATADSIHSL